MSLRPKKPRLSASPNREPLAASSWLGSAHAPIGRRLALQHATADAVPDWRRMSAIDVGDESQLQAAGDDDAALRTAEDDDAAHGTAENDDAALGTAGDDDAAHGTAGDDDAALGTAGETNAALGTAGENDAALGTTDDDDAALGPTGENDAALGTAGDDDAAPVNYLCEHCLTSEYEIRKYTRNISSEPMILCALCFRLHQLSHLVQDESFSMTANFRRDLRRSVEALVGFYQSMLEARRSR